MLQILKNKKILIGKMIDTVIRCDVCECIIERIGNKNNINDKHYCDDCYYSKFKQIIVNSYEELLEDIEFNMDSKITYDELKSLIDNKIQTLEDGE